GQFHAGDQGQAWRQSSLRPHHPAQRLLPHRPPQRLLRPHHPPHRLLRPHHPPPPFLRPPHPPHAPPPPPRPRPAPLAPPPPAQPLLRPHHPAQGPPRLGVTGQGVMVGEREDVEAGLPGPAHHLGRRIRAIRGRAVAVQVDAHERSVHARANHLSPAGAATWR